MVKKIILKDGLRILVVPQKSTEAATILVLVGTGSKYETKEIKGISHFLEHLYFKGTKKRPNSLSVAEAMDKLGGAYNAFTSEEYTGYYAKVSSSHFNKAIDWVADIYLNSLLPRKEIEKERKVIIEEINMYFDTPMIYIGELWKSLLYGDQPAGWDVAGTKETVSQITREQIVSYRQSQYVASNTIVCLAGKFSAKQAIDRVKKLFSGISVGRPKDKPLVIEKQAKPGLSILYKETDQTHLALGVRGFNIFHPQRFSFNILGIILGGMMSSRLFTEIRDKLGLAYYIKTEVESDQDSGYLLSRAGIDNKRINQAVSVILREYKKISSQKVDSKELKKAKENFKGKLALSLESSDAKASFFAGQELLEKRITSLPEIFRKIDKVSQNDILKTAKHIFKPEKLNLALIGPFKDRAKVEKLLKL